MKILYHHRIRSKDGQYVHLEEMVMALRRLGHEVEIAGPSHVESEEFGADAGLVDWLKRWMPRPLYELLEFSYAFPDYVGLASAIRRFRPDIIYERYNLFFPSGIWASRWFSIPLMLEVNAPLFEERARYSGGIALRRLAKWSEDYAWTKADHVMPVTAVLAEKVKAAGVRGHHMTVIHNGIHEAQFANLPSRPQSKQSLGLDGRFVLGFVGFMRDWHGLERVIKFIAQNPDLRLHALFVGDGPVRKELEGLASELGISDRLTITGIVNREQIPETLAAFDIALQPAVVGYASPLKLFEYLAAGLPVLAPDSNNIREILADGENAVLFRDGDEASFIGALNLLCRDEGLRDKLGSAARRTIGRMGLTWTANAERVSTIAESLRTGPSA
jgi:glycosyltransferase involved in cell wall biosynthesis